MNLSAQQKACIGPGRRKVVAGAGTGKTATLVEQVRHWLEMGIEPHKILAVTFTHRAGRELQERIERAGLPYIPAGTIHSWAYQLLCAIGERYTLAMEEDVQDILAMLAESAGLGTWAADQIAKMALVVTGQKPAGKGWMAKPGAVALMREARGYMTAHGLIYVDEVIPLATKAIQEGKAAAYMPEALAWDEYQDVTEPEAALHAAIRPEHEFVVGDPRQAIYGFRGGDAGIMMRLQSDTSHSLTECWRCPQSVIDVANTIESRRQPLHPAVVRETVVVETEECDAWDAIQRYGDASKPLVVLCRSNARAKTIATYLPGAVALVKGADIYAMQDWRLRSYVVRALLHPECEWVRWRARQCPDEVVFLASCRPELATLADIFPQLAHDEHSALRLPEWLTWYARRDIAERIQEIEADVITMTIHAAKGLEFPHVAVDMVSAPKSDDDRACLYVAVTRAQQALLLTGAPGEVVP